MKTMALTMLLVEDDEIDALALRRVLTDLGFDGTLRIVGTLVDAAKALAAPSRPVDLVLLDINLPDGSGCEFLEQRRAAATVPQPPMVMLTSSDDTRDLDRCFAAGAAGYFMKSLDSASLARSLRAILDYWEHSLRPATARF